MSECTEHATIAWNDCYVKVYIVIIAINSFEPEVRYKSAHPCSHLGAESESVASIVQPTSSSTSTVLGWQQPDLLLNLKIIINIIVVFSTAYIFYVLPCLLSILSIEFSLYNLSVSALIIQISINGNARCRIKMDIIIIGQAQSQSVKDGYKKNQNTQVKRKMNAF